MEIKETTIPGVIIMIPRIFSDQRGSFVKTFDTKLYESFGLETEIKEQFYSISHKNVIRGMHFQTPPNDCAKYVSVSSGRIIDVILDLRKGSPTYLESVMIEISQKNGKIVYIPRGCAHGFISLKDSTCTRYLQTQSFAKENDCGIHYNSFYLDWGVQNPILSERDLSFPKLIDFESPFNFIA